MTFEKYLKGNFERGVIDFKLRCYEVNERPCFYIHPDSKDGETPDFQVSGNELIPKYVHTMEEEIESIEIRNWTNKELTIQVCRDYYPFPATQPKFHLGELVRHIDFTRSGVIIAIGSECPALEWIYIVLFSNAERLDVRECYESDLASVKSTNN